MVLNYWYISFFTHFSAALRHHEHYRQIDKSAALEEIERDPIDD